MWPIFIFSFHFVSFVCISHQLILTSFTHYMEIELCVERLTLQSVIIFVIWSSNLMKMKRKKSRTKIITLYVYVVDKKWISNNSKKFMWKMYFYDGRIWACVYSNVFFIDSGIFQRKKLLVPWQNLNWPTTIFSGCTTLKLAHFANFANIAYHTYLRIWFNVQITF